MDQIGESTKYYRDHDGFVYRKTGENERTIYLDCLNAPNCLAGARLMKQSNEVRKLGNHTDQKPEEHLALKIAFESLLKIKVRKPENEGVSVLNLYKRAKKDNLGLWLPIGHQQEFLVKLRRIRKYEKEKKTQRVDGKNRRKAVRNMVDVGTSPTPPISPPLMTRSQAAKTPSPVSVAITPPRTPLPRKAKTAALNTLTTKKKAAKTPAKTPRTLSKQNNATTQMTPSTQNPKPSSSGSASSHGRRVTAEALGNSLGMTAKSVPKKSAMKTTTKKTAATTHRKRLAVKKVSFAVNKSACRRSLQFGSTENVSANGC